MSNPIDNTGVVYGYTDGAKVSVPLGERVAAYVGDDSRACWSGGQPRGIGLYRVVNVDTARPIWDTRTGAPAVTTQVVIEGKTQRLVLIEEGMRSLPFCDLDMTRPNDPRLTTRVA
jgi:hypothetical protein